MRLLTKSQQVEQEMRSAIVDGRWAVGERIPAEPDLAAEFGAARVTVREALSGLAQDGLVTRRPGIGTIVARKPSAGTVTIVSDARDLAMPVLYADSVFLQSAIDEIGSSGYRLVLSIGHGDGSESFVSSLHLFEPAVLRETLGVLNAVHRADIEARLEQEGIPCVNVGFNRAISRKNCVAQDHHKMFELAAETFRSRGHDDFAVFACQYSKEEIGERVYQWGLESHLVVKSIVGIPEDRWVWVPYTPDLRHVESVFREWWNRHNRPRAVFFDDDCVFDIASKVIIEMGIRVPDDLAVVTQANAGRKYRLNVPLIESDLGELVRTAWGMLRKLIEGHPLERTTIYLEPKVRNIGSL